MSRYFARMTQGATKWFDIGQKKQEKYRRYPEIADKLDHLRLTKTKFHIKLIEL